MLALIGILAAYPLILHAPWGPTVEKSVPAQRAEAVPDAQPQSQADTDSEFTPAEWYDLGLQKTQEGDFKTALSHLENCAEKIPECGYDFGRALGRNGETAIASNTIYAAFNRGFLPRTVLEADTVLASLFGADGKLSQVHRVVEHTLQLPGISAQETAKLQGTLGFSLVKAQRFKEAIPYLEKASKISSEDGQTLYTLGVALYMVNRQEEGLELLEQVAAMTSSTIAGDANCFLYGIYKNGGELELAHERQQTGLRLNPHSPMCHNKHM